MKLTSFETIVRALNVADIPKFWLEANFRPR